MNDPIRSTRLRIPLDENGVPMVVAVAGNPSGKSERSTRLDWPVNGCGVPKINIQGLDGGGTAARGTVVLSLVSLDGYIPVDPNAEYSKTTYADLYQYLTTHCPNFVRDITQRPHLFGFNP
jgi:cephalosporin-C deacetylase-like acetyl esterase